MDLGRPRSSGAKNRHAHRQRRTLCRSAHRPRRHIHPARFLTAAKSLLDAGEARPNEGARVVVGANGPLKTLYQTLQKTFNKSVEGREVLFAHNLADARAIIRGLALDR